MPYSAMRCMASVRICSSMRWRPRPTIVVWIERIVVVLGDRDVVLEAARDDLPVGVHDAEGAVAIGEYRDDDAEADHVRELFQRDLLALDLRRDRPGGLHARRDARLDAGFRPRAWQPARFRSCLMVASELRLHLGKAVGDGLVVIGLERA